MDKKYDNIAYLFLVMWREMRVEKERNMEG